MQEGIRHMKMSLIIAGLALSLLAMPAKADQWSRNGVTVVCPWAEATRNGITNAPVYMGIYATSQAEQRLMEASSPIAERGEIASYTRVAGILRRQRIQFLPIPAGQAVQLLPGGYHVFLDGLKEPLIAGNNFELLLEFEPAGNLQVEVQVVPIGAGPPCGGQPTCVCPPAGVTPLQTLPAQPPAWIPSGPGTPGWIPPPGWKGSY
jgi:copper(I)-binding protein